MSAFALQFQHAQQQSLSPRMQKAVALLHMSTLEFTQAMALALADNPLLDAPEPCGVLAPPGTTAASARAAAPPTASAGQPLPAGSDHSAERFDAAGLQDHATGAADAAWEAASEAAAWDEGAGWAPAGTASGAHSDSDPLVLLPQHTTLQAHLLAQLRLVRLPERTFVLACLLTQELHDDGYLRTPLQDVAALAQLSPAATKGELQAALACVQSLEPVGVGARDLSECLALQLDAVPCPDQRALCARLLEQVRRTSTLADARQLARALRCTPEAVQQALQCLRRLHPHPGWQVGGEPTHHVLPDVLVRRTPGGWEAVLNDAVVPRMRVNPHYATLLQKHPRASGSALHAQLGEARWTVRQVAQRFSTILLVAQSILQHQQAFFEHGPLAMRPLGLREVAEALGMHVSTISRVTHQKYMATPLGTFELKHFFSRALPADSGAPYSSTAIRTLVQEMIEGEPAQQRLSDVTIAQQLQRRGIDVARRTVTKYRLQLGLPAAQQRAALH